MPLPHSRVGLCVRCAACSQGGGVVGEMSQNWTGSSYQNFSTSYFSAQVNTSPGRIVFLTAPLPVSVGVSDGRPSLQLSCLLCGVKPISEQRNAFQVQHICIVLYALWPAPAHFIQDLFVSFIMSFCACPPEHEPLTLHSSSEMSCSVIRTMCLAQQGRAVRAWPSCFLGDSPIKVYLCLVAV